MAILCACSLSSPQWRWPRALAGRGARSICATSRPPGSSRRSAIRTSRCRIPRRRRTKHASTVSFTYRDGLLCAEHVPLDDIARRVKPDIDARTHPYISTGLRESKFGIAHDDAERLYLRAARIEHLEIVGIGCHIGSLLADAAPFVAAVDRLGRLADRLAAAGVALRHIDVGGGIGIAYRDDDTQQPIRAFVAGTLAALGQRAQKLIFDPGRSIVGNAGVLLTRVEYVKPGRVRNFLVVDCAMNDLLRPPLYGA